MKKFLKVIAIITAIAAAAAAVYYLLKKYGFFSDCDMDCEHCDLDCECAELGDDEDDSFENREYVSIQPKAQEA